MPFAISSIVAGRTPTMVTMNLTVCPLEVVDRLR
jgi:hypothetical protein